MRHFRFAKCETYVLLAMVNEIRGKRHISPALANPMPASGRKRTHTKYERDSGNVAWVISNATWYGSSLAVPKKRP
jgi:hypothetical protein